MNPKQVIDAKTMHEMNSAALGLTISQSLARWIEQINKNAELRVEAIAAACNPLAVELAIELINKNPIVVAKITTTAMNIVNFHGLSPACKAV